MPKNILQDVVPPDKKSIKRIPIPRREDTSVRIPITPVESEPVRPQMRERPIERVPVQTQMPRADFRENFQAREPSMPYRQENYSGAMPVRKPNRKYLLWILGIAVVAGLVFFLSSMWSTADVVVTQRVSSGNLNASFSAAKNVGDQPLSYAVMTISKETDAAVTSTSSAASAKGTPTKASGTIVIFNNNAESQPLVKTTRFEVSNGLIYRINSSIIVPGSTKNSSGTVVPGSIEALVTADQAGENYNIGKTDFTIPGFSGSPKFKTIFARSKTEMTGGTSGKSTAPASPQLSSIEDDLVKSLVAEAGAQVPAGYVLLTNSYSAVPTVTQATSSGSSAATHIKETVSFILFPQDAISNEIAKAINVESASSTISNLSSLTFSTPSMTQASLASALAAENPITFTLSGNPTVTWNLNADTLKTELAGRPRRNLNDILARYPAIDKADVTIKPFWLSSFPKNTADINIITK